MKINILFLTTSLIFLSCKGFEDLDATMINGQVTFDNKEISETCSNRLIVNDFWVQYVGDNETKIAWSIIRENSLNTKDRGFNFPLIYGIAPQGVKVSNPAIKLSPGKFNYSGTIVCTEENNETGYEFVGRFTIDKKGNFSSE